MCECKEQLCWSCRKATGGCSWSKSFKPVEGWEAKPTRLGNKIKSFKVKSCPEYEADEVTMITFIDLAKLLKIKTYDMARIKFKQLKSIANRQGIEIVFYFDTEDNTFELGIKKFNPPCELLETG